jgi:hypothetical protein
VFQKRKLRLTAEEEVTNERPIPKLEITAIPQNLKGSHDPWHPLDQGRSKEPLKTSRRTGRNNGGRDGPSGHINSFTAGAMGRRQKQDEGAGGSVLRVVLFKRRKSDGRLVERETCDVK